jgi:hypothetical protein
VPLASLRPHIFRRPLALNAAVSTQCHCHPHLTLHQQYRETFSALLEGNGKFTERAQDDDEAIPEVPGLKSRRISYESSNISRYACETGSKFIGCCISDPCPTGCAGDRLRPAGFATKLHSKSPGGSCGGKTDFWTCTAIPPTFWGCCNANPCVNNSTYPAGKLEPAVMDRAAQYEYFGALNVLLSSTLPSATSTPSVSVAASQLPASSNFGSSKVSGAVIGGATGGVVAFLVIIGVVILLLLRRSRRKQMAGAVSTVETEIIANKDVQAMEFSPQFSGHSRGYLQARRPDFN